MTPDASPPLIEISGVLKNYAGLRPLRIRELTLARGDRVALDGLDGAAAETLVHLITGASVPDEGAVRIAGQDTREIATDTDWLSSLDRFGIVTERAVLLDGLTTAANLALPMTLSIDPIPPEVDQRVRALADEVELPAERIGGRAAALTDLERVRLHLARALALDPAFLLLEHPTARLAVDADARAFGSTLRKMSERRNLGWLALTADDRFARASGGTRARLQPATGKIRAAGFWR